MSKPKLDPKVKELLSAFSQDIGTLIDQTLVIADSEEFNICQIYDGISHIMAQRLGQLEVLHLESDMKTDDPDKRIDKDLLAKFLSSVQVNAIHSLSMGMNDVLKSGGHYTLDQLKSDIMDSIKNVKVKPSSDEDDEGNGRTFH